MRGRTNVPGGGMEINGDKINLTVKSGVTINEGDFVQIDDSITPTTVSESIGNTSANIFELSDGRQICFYWLGTDVKAIVETVNSSGLADTDIKTVLNNYAGGAYGGVYAIKLGSDSFMIAIPKVEIKQYTSSTYYAYNTFYLYKIDYNVQNDTFTTTDCGSIGLVSGAKNTSYSTFYSKPALFIMRKLSSTELFIVCDRNESASYSGTTARTEALVYDFVNKTIKARIRETTLSMTTDAQSKYDEYLCQINTNKFLFVMPYTVAGGIRNTAMLIYDYNGTDTITNTMITRSDNFLGVLHGYGNNKFFTAFGTALNLCMIVNNTITVIDTFVVPFSVDRIYYIHGKVFVSNLDSGTVNKLCEVVYDSSTDSISFSDVSQNVLYVSRRIDTTNAFLCSYYGTNRRTVRESGGSFYSYSNLQTVKKYANRIDGVAETGGTGGDTISVFVPAS